LLAVAIALTAWLLPNVDINGGFFAVLWIAALFGLINAVLGTILRILTLPLTLLTLGLFSLVVNAVLVEITSACEQSFRRAWILGRLLGSHPDLALHSHSRRIHASKAEG
jgi:uncharacterized membrane protein YvlD (DUF360 family)